MLAMVHITVEGLVQGVGFRWFVFRKAESLTLSGFVRNLPNGNVEVLATGPEGMLHELIKELRIGPRAARVTSLKIDWMPPSSDVMKGEQTGFEIR